jgi:NAD(P)-dependent dehydrogenase (short-subunit alcohol dehydrogenase family)
MRILNVSSMAGIVNGGIEKNPYHCSKHAVQSFTMNLRVELAPFNIIVSSINPSFHATPIVEMMDQATNDRYTNLPQHLKDQYGEGKKKRENKTGHNNKQTPRFFCSWFLENEI